MAERDEPWMMRTYSGHSTAQASNELYRTNLAKGQTGLSIAFDLPTQTGYDPDDPQARGEVGKVGVPVAHLGHMEQLLDGIPVGEMNTSMTINATAAWLLGLYVANAERHGVASRAAAGHDPERHRQGVPVPRHLHLPAAPVAAADRRHGRLLRRADPEVEPDERLQLPPAGGGGDAGAGARLLPRHRHRRARRRAASRARSPTDRFPAVFASISFFVNAGIRFVEETCKMRAFVDLWERIGRERYGVTDDKALRFRYGVQVNSLGLTEAQPENNVQRIVLEALGVTLSKKARARSIQLPAWNEALGLPRPWDQQWSLRIQQVLAYETDLLEYGDILDGSKVVEAKTAELADEAWAELDDVLALGGAFEAIDELKGRLVRSHTERMRRIETGELVVVGVNRFTETEPSPLGGRGVDPQGRPRRAGRADRRRAGVAIEPRRRRREAQPRRAAAGRRVRARTSCRRRSTSPTPAARPASGPASSARCSASTGRRRASRPPPAPAGAPTDLRAVAERVKAMAGGPPRFLVAKPGPRRPQQRRRADRRRRPRRRHGGRLPGHPAHAGADRGGGARRGRRRRRPLDPVGQPPGAGARGRAAARARPGVDAPVVVGGIIPEDDRPPLLAAGVAAVYTPKDFELGRLMAEIADLAERRPRLER